jgi:PII-like signaling protein
MSVHPRACRLMVIIDEEAMFNHRPLYQELVRRAHDAGLAGASVFRGVEGFGAGRAMHTTRILSLSGGLPAMIVIIDSEERIREFLPQLDEMDVQGVVALDEVEIVWPGNLPESLR